MLLKLLNIVTRNMLSKFLRVVNQVEATAYRL